MTIDIHSSNHQREIFKTLNSEKILA
jgi:hypothetical protein